MSRPPGFYTYLLSDPRNGEVFYVGKGHGDRVSDHLKFRGPNFTLKQRVSEINRAGKTVTVSFAAAADEAHAFEMERALIKALGRRDLGKGPLLNLTDGGEGAAGIVQTAATKAKVRAVRSDAAYRQNMAEATRQRWSDPAYRERVAAAIRDAKAKRTPEQVAAQCAKRSASLGAEGHRNAGLKRAATMGPERLRRAAEKANITRGPEARSDVGRKRAATMRERTAKQNT